MEPQYVVVLSHALEQRAFKVDHRTTDSLHAIADRLGTLSAGPRDVIDVHLAGLRQRLAQSAASEGAAIAEEARLLVLELMGHVVTYYRNHTLGMRA